MHIGFDAKRIFNNRTGLGNYSRTLLNNLQRYFPEHQYNLFTPRISTNEFGEYYSKHFPVVTPDGIGGTFWRSYGIKNSIKKSEISVFHGLSNELPFRIRKVKKVLTIHDLIFKALPYTYPFFDRQVYDFKSKKSCQSADVIIAISQSTKDAIMHYYGISEDKIKVVYQACNDIYYENEPCRVDVRKKFNLPQEYILSVGTISPRKNLLNTVKALIALPKDLDVPLVVVGNGKGYKAKVLDFLQQKNSLNRVLLLDNVHSTKDLKGLYKNALFSIYPSKNEGFGLPVSESLLCKTAVITSNTSSLPEAGGTGALLVNPEDVDEIAHAIEKLLENENQRKELARNGYTYAWGNFNPQKVTTDVMNIYKKLS